MQENTKWTKFENKPGNTAVGCTENAIWNICRNVTVDRFLISLMALHHLLGSDEMR